jgi:Fur family ferric uptake transcriptional regulator
MSDALDREVDVVEQHMRARGLRWTNQRRLIARAALRHHSHFSAEELLAWCRREQRGVSRATVYRTLAMLEDAGFVEGLELGPGGKLYEHVLGHAHHDHMVCTACGAIVEFVDQALERRQDAVAKRLGFEIRSHSLRLYGVCAEHARTGKLCAKGRRGPSK